MAVTVLRRDGLTGDWVVVAPERARRPQRHGVGAGPEACPFCPGNEAMLPDILAEWPAPTPPGWAVRMVPNRYPVVAPDASPTGPGDYPARGRHEVVVESPDHEASLATLPAERAAVVLAACRDRLRRLAGLRGIRSIVLFRNQGHRAGASLSHPHSQIVALGFVAPLQVAMTAHAAAHHAATGRCPICDVLDTLRSNPGGWIEETAHFAAAVPFGARGPAEAWIMPKRHGASLAETGDDEIRDFAALLGRVLRRLRAGFDDPPWNYVVDQAAIGDEGRPDLHWKLRLMPALSRPGGLELGTGLAINPSDPEADAARYRSAPA